MNTGRKDHANGFLQKSYESPLNVLDPIQLQNSFRFENYHFRRKNTDNLQFQKHNVKSIRKRSEGSKLADHFADNNNHKADHYDGGHRNGSDHGESPYSEVDPTGKLSEDYLNGAYGLQLHEQSPADTTNNKDHDTVGFGLSYRVPAFIESRATWQHRAYKLDVPVAQSQLLDEDDNTTDSHAGDDGTKSRPLNEEQKEGNIAAGDKLDQPADRLSFTEKGLWNFREVCVFSFRIQKFIELVPILRRSISFSVRCLLYSLFIFLIHCQIITGNHFQFEHKTQTRKKMLHLM